MRGVEVREGAGDDEAPVAALGHCVGVLVVDGKRDKEERRKMGGTVLVVAEGEHDFVHCFGVATDCEAFLI